MKHLHLHKRTKNALLGLGLLMLVGLLLVCGAAAESEARQGEILTGNEERVAYLKALGWDVSEQPTARQEVIIPRSFSDVFENYNTLQKQQGFDLEDYKGLTVSLYTYEVTNWPEPGLTVLADLYLYRNRVIAGDVHATAMDGFMIGIR